MGKQLARAMFDGVVILRNGKILAMNRALVRWLGWRAVAMLGRQLATMALTCQLKRSV